MSRELNHILFITPGFASNEEDTACLTYFQNYLLALKEEQPGLKLTVLALHYPFERKQYTWNGIRVFSIGAANKGKLQKPFLWGAAIKLIQKISRENAIDIIHSLWMRECALLGNYIGSKIGAGHLCTAMGTELSDQNIYLRLLDLKKMKIVCVSEVQQEQLKTKASDVGSSVIPWGLDVGDIDDTENRNMDIDILFVGNISPIKDIPMFMEVLSKLVSKKAGLVAKIVGANESGINIPALIEKHKLEKTVEFLGAMSNEKVQHLMARSKILLHTSSFESFGYVFLEALRQGMSIVSKQVGIASPSEQWKLGDSVEDFADAALYLLEKDIDRNPVELYPLKQTVSKYLDLYNEMAGIK